MLTTVDVHEMIKEEFFQQSIKYAMRCDDIRNINAIIKCINPNEKPIERPYPVACIMCVISGVSVTRGEYR